MVLEIVSEALNELDGYLIRLNKGINDAVDLFRGQQEGEGIKLLVQIIEGLNWSIEVVFQTKETFENHDAIVDENKTIELLNEIVGALENQDFVLLADLMEYEVLEMTAQWQKALSKMEFVH